MSGNDPSFPRPPSQQPPPPQPFGSGPATPPPASNGVARALAFARGLSGKTMVLALIVIAAQAILPNGRRPSDIIGAFHGSTESAEMKAKQAAAVLYEQQIAAARAIPPANAQIEAATAQAQQKAVSDSLQTQSAAANIADAACLLSGFVTPMFGNTPDSRQIARSMHDACGAGDKIRQGMTNALANSARTGSAVIQRDAPGVTQPVAPVIHSMER